MTLTVLPINDAPKPGETCWKYLKDADSPWPTLSPVPIRILDVKDGWVRYTIGDGSPDVLKIQSFTRMYRRT